MLKHQYMIDAYLCIQIVAYDTWDIYEGFGSTQWLGFNDVLVPSLNRPDTGAEPGLHRRGDEGV